MAERQRPELRFFNYRADLFGGKDSAIANGNMKLIAATLR
jgi:hypothetical protein